MERLIVQCWNGSLPTRASLSWKLHPASLRLSSSSSNLISISMSMSLISASRLDFYKRLIDWLTIMPSVTFYTLPDCTRGFAPLNCRELGTLSLLLILFTLLLWLFIALARPSGIYWLVFTKPPAVTTFWGLRRYFCISNWLFIMSC